MKIHLVILFISLFTSLSFSQDKATIDGFYDAIFANDLPKVKTYLKNKIPGNFEPEGKITPLQAAIWENHLDIVQLLVEAGANINSPQKSAVNEAAEYGRLEILQYLVSKGGNINEKTRSAFDIAAFHKHYDIAKYLLSIDSEQNMEDSQSRLNMYLMAVEKGDYEVLNLLKLNEDELNFFDCTGQNSLIIAVRQNNVDMVKYLLKRGVDKEKPETFDCGDDINYGDKPIIIARKLQFQSIVDILK